MTFKQIIDDAVERVGNDKPEARVRFRNFVNEWYHRILSRVPLPRGTSGTIAVVAGTEQYTLAAGVGRLINVYDPTHNVTLHERSVSFIRNADPNASQSGIPQFYAYITNRIIEVWPSPAANNTINIDYEAVVSEMDEDADIPVIDEDFHYLLSLGVRINEYERNSDSRLREAKRDMEIGIADLKFWNASRRGNVLNPGNTGARHGSRLGGWYPRGS